MPAPWTIPLGTSIRPPATSSELVVFNSLPSLAVQRLSVRRLRVRVDQSLVFFSSHGSLSKSSVKEPTGKFHACSVSVPAVQAHRQLRVVGQESS